MERGFDGKLDEGSEKEEGESIGRFGNFGILIGDLKKELAFSIRGFLMMVGSVGSVGSAEEEESEE